MVGKHSIAFSLVAAATLMVSGTRALAQDPAELSAAERIARLQRTIEREEKYLRMHEAELSDPLGEYEEAESRFKDLDERLSQLHSARGQEVLHRADRARVRRCVRGPDHHDVVELDGVTRQVAVAGTVTDPHGDRSARDGVERIGGAEPDWGLGQTGQWLWWCWPVERSGRRRDDEDRT